MNWTQEEIWQTLREIAVLPLVAALAGSALKDKTHEPVVVSGQVLKAAKPAHATYSKIAWF